MEVTKGTCHLHLLEELSLEDINEIWLDWTGFELSLGGGGFQADSIIY